MAPPVTQALTQDKSKPGLRNSIMSENIVGVPVISVHLSINEAK